MGGRGLFATTRDVVPFSTLIKKAGRPQKREQSLLIDLDVIERKRVLSFIELSPPTHPRVGGYRAPPTHPRGRTCVGLGGRYRPWAPLALLLLAEPTG